MWLELKFEPIVELLRKVVHTKETTRKMSPAHVLKTAPAARLVATKYTVANWGNIAFCEPSPNPAKTSGNVARANAEYLAALGAAYKTTRCPKRNVPNTPEKCPVKTRYKAISRVVDNNGGVYKSPVSNGSV